MVPIYTNNQSANVPSNIRNPLQGKSELKFENTKEERVEWVENMKQKSENFHPTFFLLIIKTKFFNISLWSILGKKKSVGPVSDLGCRKLEGVLLPPLQFKNARLTSKSWLLLNHQRAEFCSSISWEKCLLEYFPHF